MAGETKRRWKLPLRRSPYFNKDDQQECGCLPLQYVQEMDRWAFALD